MRNVTTQGLVIALFLIMSVAVFAQDKAELPAAVKMSSTTGGDSFTDSNGMTLYTFDKDATPGKSVCNGACAQNWPPLLASGNDKQMDDWTIVSRDDGTQQWAYKNKPLYRFAKDSKSGDATGDGFLNGAWHIAKP